MSQYHYSQMHAHNKQKLWGTDIDISIPTSNFGEPAPVLPIWDRRPKSVAHA